MYRDQITDQLALVQDKYERVGDPEVQRGCALAFQMACADDRRLDSLDDVAELAADLRSAAEEYRDQRETHVACGLEKAAESLDEIGMDDIEEDDS